MKQIITILSLLISHQVIAQTALYRNDQLTNNRTQIINSMVHSDFAALFHPNKIQGTITNEDGQFLAGAIVSLKQKDADILTSTTDSLGRYSIQPQRLGIYDLRVSYHPFQDADICDINIDGSGNLAINGSMQMHYRFLQDTYYSGCMGRPSSIDQGPGYILLSAEKLERLPTRDLTDIISVTGIGTTIH